jgi:hypothetical protein
MTKSEKEKALIANTCLWVAAILLPVICHFGFASTKFPWPIILPLLLMGPMLASNKLLSKTSGETTDDPETNTRE